MGQRAAAAESLGVSRKTLFNKMRQHGLSADDSAHVEAQEAEDGAQE